MLGSKKSQSTKQAVWLPQAFTKEKNGLFPHVPTLLELKGCFNPAVVTPVTVLSVIAIQMQVTIRCKGIVDYRWQPFGCKLSSVCDVVVQEWNVHTDVAYIIQIILADS